MKKQAHRFAIISVITLALAACAPLAQADYVTYNSVDDLAAQSTDVAQVTIRESREATLESQKFTGENPETNPYFGGDGEEPSAEDLSVDVTIFTATIDETYKGSKKAGSVVEISQLHGVADTVPLESGQTYVLFLNATSPDYPAGIVAGSQGQYQLSDGKLVPASDEIGLELSFDQLTKID